MTTYIKYTEGKVYDPAHLKPFDLQLAKLGHPLSDHDGKQVLFLFEYRPDNFIAILQNYVSFIEDKTAERLRLAPLGIKDGKPLHVGEYIEVFYNGLWQKTTDYTDLILDWRSVQGDK